MLDFNFKNPTNILFGKGKIAVIKECIPAESRVLILYGGGSVKKNGTLDDRQEITLDVSKKILEIRL
jgi:NADP-dependent alcohol dehydrogenase